MLLNEPADITQRLKSVRHAVDESVAFSSEHHPTSPSLSATPASGKRFVAASLINVHIASRHYSELAARNVRFGELSLDLPGEVIV